MDGTVTYSQDPPDAGARDVKRIDVKTLSPEQVWAARRLLGADTRRADAAANAREQALSAADREVRAATSVLSDAETALTSGREPLPGGAPWNGERQDPAHAGLLRPPARVRKSSRERAPTTGPCTCSPLMRLVTPGSKLSPGFQIARIPFDTSSAAHSRSSSCSAPDGVLLRLFHQRSP